MPKKLSAQAPWVEWQKVIGNEHGDYSRSVHATSDGGYVVVGYREGTITDHGNGTFNEDEWLWVTKLDHDGRVVWEFPVLNATVLTPDIMQTPDGGFAIAASSSALPCNATGSLDTYIVKLNSDGSTAWKKHYGGTQSDYAYSIDLAPDHGYFLAGISNSSDGDVTGSHGDFDGWVIKLNEAGDLVWQKALGGSQADQLYSVKATADGGCVVSGNSRSTDGDVFGAHGNLDAWVVKLSSAGTIDWQKSLGGSRADLFNAAVIAPDGGYVIAGVTASNDGDVSGNHHAAGPFGDFWLVHLSAAGSIIWQKCYGGDLNEEAFALSSAPGGGYAVIGYAQSSNGDLTCNKGIEDVWVIRTDASGNLLWQKSLGGSHYDEGFGIEALADGSYIFTAETCSREVAGYHQSSGPLGTCGDFWIVKLTAGGAVAPSPQIKIDPASVTVCPGTAAVVKAAATGGGANSTYTWMLNGTPAGDNSPVFTAASLKAGDVLSCTYTSAGSCENMTPSVSDQVTLKGSSLSGQPFVSISVASEFICNCTPVRFTAGVTNQGSVPVYQWAVNGVNQETNSRWFESDKLAPGDRITCTYTDQSICIPRGAAVSNTVVLKAAAAGTPTVAISTPSATICGQGPAVIAAVSANGGARPTYQWTINGLNAGTGQDTLVVAHPKEGDNVNCTMTIDPNFTCSNAVNAKSNDITIHVQPEQETRLTISASDSSICAGNPVILTASTTGAGASPEYQWILNGRPQDVATATWSAANLKDGDQVYARVLPGEGSCLLMPLSSESLGFHVYQVPAIQLYPLDTVVRAFAQVQFNAFIEGDYQSFKWAPETALVNPSSTEPLTQPVTTATRYQLTVLSAEGCTATASASIKISRDLYMPNAFSPNHDGHNDVFRIPEGTTISLKEFSVFDRWGKRVFSTNDLSRGWDGLYKGHLLSGGMYVYVLKGSDQKGSLLQKGTVMLVR